MEENAFLIDVSDEAFIERYTLSMERIREFPGLLQGAYGAYFETLSALALRCDAILKGEAGSRAQNEALYAELLPGRYENSFLHPGKAAELLGGPGQYLCVWYAEFRGIIPFSFERRLRDITVMLETCIQLFMACEAFAERGEAPGDGLCGELSEILYSYLYDYAGEFVGGDLADSTDPANAFARDIVMNADLSDTGEHSYLYSFGEWVTEEELGTARLLASLPEEEIERMAESFTKGYLDGFALTGKDVSKKSVVGCYLPLGFERFLRAAVRRFEAAGLQTVIGRHPVHLLAKKTAANIRPGFYGACSRQYEYDHREDLALFWGDKLRSAKLRALKEACSSQKDVLAAFSGHACVETFGISAPALCECPARPVYSAHQREVSRAYAYEAHEILREYMPDEETSFTIIAWPTPSVAGEAKERYREIFEHFIRINTLPADKWRRIQQCLADAMDRARWIEVRGVTGNDTDIRVMLHTLSDPEKETNFENCLADVNIPVGEVFTSPVLKGTDGTIHAGYVYIGGCLFEDLKIRFEDGRVAEYSCRSGADPEEGRALIRRLIFKDRERLPLGEFAVGTNTEAYAAAGRYGIADRLPVLIAEKTGPHFAVGDTCYAYEEEIVSCNPDGKRITARENECSALRHTQPDKAYFQVHTDITLPYEDIASVAAVGEDGRTVIIENGRFVLPGTEELNHALEA